MKICVIGAGFSGIATASFLAKQGHEVTVIEKNEQAGGRASKMIIDGFTFDMGPSWYWMPDVFERYFKLLGEDINDWLDLIRLNPSYRIFFEGEDKTDIPGNTEELYKLFDKLEPNGAQKLNTFLTDAKVKYDNGINDLVHRPSLSIKEFIDFNLFKKLPKLKLFSSLTKEINGLFDNEKPRKILEFPAYFLGALPKNTPALYSLMNYADLILGTWYPKGGMFKIIEAMVAVAKKHGVKFVFNESVTSFNINNKGINGVVTDTNTYNCDVCVASADYHFVEQTLLPKAYRIYNEPFWNKQTLAPSALIFYLGINQPIEGLEHHNLFFDENFDAFGHDIYTDPKWPRKPLFYACCPSKTDDTVAPKNQENLFLLMPLAPNLQDTETLRETYFDLMINKLEKKTKQSIRQHITVKKSFCINDFKSRYNSYKGNAYGLANTLFQTAFFKPKIKNTKLNNLYYAGQLTVPGPGVPPALISGEVVSKLINKNH